MAGKEAIEHIRKNESQFIDFRFTDLFGVWHHFTIPANDVSESLFDEGIAIDGSSIRGFQSIHESDMMLVPDPKTLFSDPFTHHATAVMVGDIVDPITRERYSRDPRYVAQKAETYLKSTGIGDTIYFGPEAEFFVFDRMSYSNSPHQAGFSIDSAEAHWNSNLPDALGYSMRPKGGYFPCAPADKLHDLRSEMVLTLQETGVDVELHHHEVGSAGQCEIDIRFTELQSMADTLQKYKYVIKNTASRYGMTVSFMPKPLFGDNGSGMHCHQSIWKNGKNMFYDKNGYAGLSDTARWYIGGLLKHAPSLLAFTNPSTNSYRRLVPGYEAPINLIYSARNRSACIRIPMLSKSEKAKRIEFRAPDPTANPYLAFSAMMMAGLDGVQNKTEPPKPIDKDLYDLPEKEKAKIQQTPRTFREVLENLQASHKYLLKGDVFTPDLIETYVEYKLRHECLEVETRVHPYEFYLYNDI